ncbi:PepSY domain-containing protein [Niallia oryzisoli]|uniref:PepSY domain-containing protein n=1 Tax=Niallia oryzisoli TaxID=1737571 RepID=A0ABZ2CEK3_9BACI
MKKKLLLWTGCVAGVIIVLFFLFNKIAGPIFTSADVLTKQEAQAITEERYTGKVNKIHQKNNLFVMELEKSTGIYEIIINRETGEVASLKQIKQKDETMIPEEQPKPVEPTKSSEPPVQDEGNVSKSLTEEEAATLALEQVAGTVDDVELENVNGITYYFVDIETTDGREAIVEINAITGEVKSLTWDDDGSDDDDD